MKERTSVRKEVTRWAVGLVTISVSALALSGCGKDISSTAQQAPVYTRESPPPFARSAEAPASDLLGLSTYYSVASGTVVRGYSRTIAGSHYSLKFASTSLTVSSLAVSVSEQSPSVIDFQLAPAGAVFSTPVTLTISYAGTNADPSSANYQNGTLTFFILNPTTGVWESLPGTNNASLKQYVVSLSGFRSLSNSASSSGNQVNIQVGLAKVPPPGTGDW